MIDDYRWRYALVAQARATEECESRLMRTMIEQGLTLRQMVAIFQIWLSVRLPNDVASHNDW